MTRTCNYYLGILLIGALGTACASDKDKDKEEAEVAPTTTAAVVANDDKEPAPPDKPTVAVMATRLYVPMDIRSACGMAAVEGADLHFDFDETKLEPEHNKELEEVVECLKSGKLADARVTVIGFADKVGTEAVNEEVAQDRAQSVVKHMSSRGVAADRLTVESRGEDQAKVPVAASDQARERDRRVELELTK